MNPLKEIHYGSERIPSQEKLNSLTIKISLLVFNVEFKGAASDCRICEVFTCDSKTVGSECRTGFH